MDDEYDLQRMLRREIFELSCKFQQATPITDKEIVEVLKNCIEFFRGGSDPDIVRDYCIAKVRQAQEQSNGKTDQNNHPQA